MIVAGSPNIVEAYECAFSCGFRREPVHERLGAVVERSAAGAVGLGDRVDGRQRLRCSC